MQLYCILTHSSHHLHLAYTLDPRSSEPGVLHYSTTSTRALVEYMDAHNKCFRALGHSVSHLYIGGVGHNQNESYHNLRTKMGSRTFLDLARLIRVRPSDPRKFVEILPECEKPEINLPPDLPPTT